MERANMLLEHIDQSQPLNKIKESCYSLTKELMSLCASLDPAQCTDRTSLIEKVVQLSEEIKQKELARWKTLLDCRDAWREHLDARKELAAVKNELDEERKQRTAAESSRKEAKMSACSLRAQLTREQGKVADQEYARKEIAMLKVELDEERKQRAAAEESASSLSAEMAMLKDELDEERKHRAVAESARKDVEECASRLSAQLAHEQETVADQEKTLRAKDNEKNYLACILKGTQRRADTSTAALHDREQQFNESRRIMEATISRLENDWNRFNNTITSQNAELVAQHRTNDKLTTRVDDLERSCKRFGGEFLQLEADLKQEQQANRVLTQAGNALRQRNRDLEIEVAGWDCIANNCFVEAPTETAAQDGELFDTMLGEPIEYADADIEATIEEPAQDGELVDTVVVEHTECADESIAAATLDADADWEKDLAGMTDIVSSDEDAANEIDEEAWYDCPALDDGEW